MATGTQPRRRKEASNAAYNNYIQGGYYSYTTEAYKLSAAAPLERERPRPVRRKNDEKAASQPKPAKKIKRRMGPEYIMAAAPLRRMSFLSVLTIFILFAGTFACLFSFAVISQRQLELNRLGKELKAVKENVVSLTADTAVLYSAEEISTLAQTRLGMSKPKDYQIVEIEIPRKSYFVQYEHVPEPEPVKLGLSGIIELFLK